MPAGKSLQDRLSAGEKVFAAEGYMFEFNKRGYLKSGAMVPEVVIEHPDLVTKMHEEFVHAGSDVVLAFTYYGNRHKLQVIGRQDEVEQLNRKALKMAREVADNTGTLMAGNLSNTTVFDPSDKDTVDTVNAMFKEQVIWAKDEKADFIVGETFYSLAEAMLSLEAIKAYGDGLPAVVNIAPTAKGHTVDDVPLEEACRKLEEAGAAVVGLNCSRGPKAMVPLLKRVRQACKGPISALPVPYRTNEEIITYQMFKDPYTEQYTFPSNMAQFQCSRNEIEFFGNACKEIGVQYIGLCCGNTSDYFRLLCETCGKTTKASRYTTDMSNHYLNTDKGLSEYNAKVRKALLGL
ncbi:betaine--homocysteine S-methyltransferase 1 isoform X2 [Octopus sinensis]|uniref:Betaine--homocysteine S-methyltransferase 1 isoform X2 n=1 Tax=Octopus sinensis TaxID=2607531 RepID=A0A6P7TDQ9_9MOLL|nr:betaine--homocysteine S-methyltransferase 1 isoform X2 [Octopus sinensis]